MRKLELYVDSKLKEFKLFRYMEEILRSGSAEVEDDLSSDELQALNLYSEFVELASILDSFSTWSDGQWSNFLTMMTLAFREKGRYSAINSLLAALGIQTEKGVEVYDTLTPGSTKTMIVKSEHFTDQPSRPEDTSDYSYLNITTKKRYTYDKKTHFCDSKWESAVTAYIDWTLSENMIDEPRPTSKELGLQYNTYSQYKTPQTIEGFTYYFFQVTTWTQVANWTVQSNESIASETPAPPDDPKPDDEYGATYCTYENPGDLVLYDYDRFTKKSITYDKCNTTVKIEIKSLDTPNVRYFSQRLQELIPRLLWVHDMVDGEVTVDTVMVYIDLKQIYEKTMYETSLRSSSTTANNISYSGSGWKWGV